MRGVAALAVALAAGGLGVAGCSADEDADTGRDGRSAADTFLAACAAGHGEAALDLLVPLQRHAFLEAGSPRAGCAEVLGLPAGADAVALERLFADARVRDVHVDGGLGTAVAELGNGTRIVLDLERAGDTWHVARPGV